VFAASRPAACGPKDQPPKPNYDNQPDAEDDAEIVMELGGGSIVIHTSKK